MRATLVPEIVFASSVGRRGASAGRRRRPVRLLRREHVQGFFVAAALATACPSALCARPDLHAQDPDTLTYPPVLENLSKLPGVVEVRLTAALAQLELEPGKPAAAFAYNGTVPGPTLELREGDSVIVHFRNELSEPTTVHWHGLHLPAGADGSPLDPVPPGGSHDYVFRVGRETAGTYWYHPHPDRTTTEQVAHGLFGALVVRAADDPLASLPDRLLVLSDNRFRDDGSVDLPDPHSPQALIDQENGREGPVLMVNGRIGAELTIRPGEVQRWRIVNASAARVYRLAIEGQKLVQVGTDGGLIEHPVEKDEVVLANSERVEVLVRGTGSPGDVAHLQTLAYDRYDPHTRPAGWDRPLDLLRLRTVGTAAPPVVIPENLRIIPPIDTTQVAERRVMVFSQGLINGKAMDMSRVDATARIGTTETWQIENVVGMDHPFHLHGFRFQVLDRDGVVEPYRGWKDSVNIPKHGVVRIAVRFDDYRGKWMFHCHILDHEDMGMMGILEVR